MLVVEVVETGEILVEQEQIQGDLVVLEVADQHIYQFYKVQELQELLLLAAVVVVVVLV